MGYNSAFKGLKSYLTNRYQRVLIGDRSSSYSSFLEWGKINHGVPQGSILGPLLFLFYVNDLPKIVQYNSKPNLFADNTSLIFSNSNCLDFKTNINNVFFFQLNKWFYNNLFLNYEKTQYVHFTLKGTVLHEVSIGYNNLIYNSTNTKILGVIIENTLSWKAHIDHLLPNLCLACYGVRTFKPFMCQENLKSIYYSYFHSLMTYGIIFLGNSTHSSHVVRLQKRVIRIITDSRPRDSCRQLFKQLGILPLTSQYIFSLLLFVANNRALFQMNSEIHNINTRYGFNFHCPHSFDNIQKWGRIYWYQGFQLPPYSYKNLSHNVNQFKLALRNFHHHSFYTLEEYYNTSNNLWT